MYPHENMKKLEWGSISSRGQGLFCYGNSTGTVFGTGFWKIFALEFGDKSFLSVTHLTSFNITTKLSAYALKIKIARVLQQVQFHYGFNMVILQGPICYRCGLKLVGTKICLKMWQAFILVILKILEGEATAGKIWPELFGVYICLLYTSPSPRD